MELVETRSEEAASVVNIGGHAVHVAMKISAESGCNVMSGVKLGMSTEGGCNVNGTRWTLGGKDGGRSRHVFVCVGNTTLLHGLVWSGLVWTAP